MGKHLTNSSEKKIEKYEIATSLIKTLPGHRAQFVSGAFPNVQLSIHFTSQEIYKTDTVLVLFST